MEILRWLGLKQTHLKVLRMWLGDETVISKACLGLVEPQEWTPMFCFVTQILVLEIITLEYLHFYCMAS